MPKLVLLLCLLLLSRALQAQLPYTAPGQYAWTVETDLPYDVATNYMGFPDTLRLDLYKPLNDGNPARPLLVLVHGGAWLGGCKNDLVWLAEEMAGRGYAVAAVNYRLGWHKDAYVPAPNCLYDLFQGNVNPKDLYPADSCEIIRALYRAQQDVKSAIRWLKARHALDSTDVCRVLVGGESAGGFNALAVGFLDRCSEKPVCCFDLPDAPTPDPNLFNRTTLDCQTHNWAIPPGSLARPDLGCVGGDGNDNGADASVIGVVSLFGGVPAEALPNDWLRGPDTPAVYLYHQTCDGIVPFGYGQPFQTLSAYCNLGCTPWHYAYPHTYGNGSLAAFFETVPGMPFSAHFDNCAAFNPNLSLFECPRYAENGSYHYTANRPLRTQQIADYFSPFILAAPPCAASTTCCSVPAPEPGSPASALRLAPNPFSDRLSLEAGAAFPEPVVLELSDVSGRVVWRDVRPLQPGRNELFHQNDWPPGVYALRAITRAGTAAWLVICQK